MVNTTLNSKKGFYVGDICYVLDDNVYDDIWGKAGYEDGVYETPFGQFAKFAVASTAYGDGSYADQFGHEYGVDAGVIGIVPWELLEHQKKWQHCYGREGTDEEKLNYLGHFFEGTEADFYATGRDGNPDGDGLFEITIGDKSVTIRTDDDGDYDEDYYEEDEDYYDQDWIAGDPDDDF